MTNASMPVVSPVWTPVRSSSPHGRAAIHHQHPTLAWLLKRLQGCRAGLQCRRVSQGLVGIQWQATLMGWGASL